MSERSAAWTFETSFKKQWHSRGREVTESFGPSFTPSYEKCFVNPSYEKLLATQLSNKQKLQPKKSTFKRLVCLTAEKY